MLFLGTVLSVTDLPPTADIQFLSSRRARIRVDEPFGEIPAGLREMDVYTGSGGGDCGIPFQAGAVYLVHASVGTDGKAHAGVCGFTRQIDAAGVLLRILRQQRDGQPIPSLTGRVARLDRTFNGLIGTRAPEALANLLVRVKAGGKVYETRADADGVYSFYGLPSGKYAFAPDLPAGSTLSWFIGSDKPPIPFELHAGACQVRDMEVFSSGAIQGRILDASGQALKRAPAYILPAGEIALPKQSQLYWEYPDTSGFFKFVHLPPGEYILVVNPDDSLDPNHPYRRTFFPGVPDRASAATIVIHGGELIKDADIRLKRQFATRNLKVRVTWANGRSIKGYVFVKATADTAGLVTYGARPNLKASVFDLNVLADETYQVQAEFSCRYTDARSTGPGARLKSNRVHLAPGDEQKKLLLTIPTNSCPSLPGKELVYDR